MYTLITGYELSLVALNRYARARMIQLINRELKKGVNFNPDYQNWTGINSDAVDVFRAGRKPYDI